MPQNARSRTVSWAASALLLLAACGELKNLPTEPFDPDPIDQSATLTRVQTEIFTPTCAVLGCHDPFGNQSQLNLTTGNSYGQIVGRPSVEVSNLNRVQPGQPDLSYLYRKILGTGITGDRMPQAGQPLSDAQKNLVRDWIRRGAPND